MATLSSCFQSPVLTDPKRQRIVMRCDVPALSRVLNAIAAGNVTLEHVYDY
jgi:hypothetical protein